MGAEWGVAHDGAENQWRRTFCQVPFGAIYEHADRGKRSLQRLVHFFRRKAEAERAASGELRALLDDLDGLEERGTSVRRALQELRGFVDASCHQQLLLAQVLDDQVAEPLESLQDASELYIRTLQGEIQNANDEYDAAAATHQDAAAAVRRATEELRDAKGRQRAALHGIGVPEFELQRLATRVKKCTDEQAQTLLAKARAKTALYNCIIARDEMSMAVSVAHQKAEEERLDQLNASLRRFLHVETERLQDAQAMLASLETHVDRLDRAEDIQLLIHNRRNPDNMHFQGKALALLDWQWTKMQAEHAEPTRRHPQSLLERRGSAEDARWASPASSASSPASRDGVAAVATSSLESPHAVLAETPLSVALHQYFAEESSTVATSRDSAEERSMDGHTSEEAEVAVLDEQASPPATSTDTSTESRAAATVSSTKAASETLVREACKTTAGRALFVKCLNAQRSLETKVKDGASFRALVACFNAFLDDCVRDDDIKAAKTAMILAETFYYPKAQRPQKELHQDSDGSEGTINPSSPSHRRSSGVDGGEGRARRRSSLGSDGLGEVERTSEELLLAVDDAHPLLHGGGIGRGATRMYLQEEVKKHPIWKTPSFWEKALLLAIGEELQRTPQPCPWEDLPSRVPKHDGLPSREEAVCRVHNIVFGQLGSFTLSMLEFEVPLPQIESFVETMCDAHELTEDHRCLLRRNLQDIFATLR